MKYEISFVSINGGFQFITTYDRSFAFRKARQFKAEGRLVSFFRG